jgi:protein TonB
VFAVLPIPVEPGKTAAVLEGARDEALSRATLAVPQASPVRVTIQSAELPPDDVEPWSEPAAVAPPARPRTPKLLLPGLIGIAVLGLAAAWYLLDRPTQRVEPESATATRAADAPDAPIPAAGPGAVETRRSAMPVVAKTTPDRVVGGSVEVLLDKADTAFRDRRYVEPETDSALLYFRSVLAQAPDNGEARQGLDRIVAVLDQRLQLAVAERRFDDAATALAQLSLVRPGDPKIQSVEIRIVEGQVAEALDAGKFDRANQLLRQSAQALPADRASYWRDEISRRQRAQQAAIAQRQTPDVARASAELRAAGATPTTPPGAPQQTRSRGEMTGAPQPFPEPERQAVAREPVTDTGNVERTETPPSVALQPSPASAPPAQVPAPLESASLERTYYVAPAYPKAAEKDGLSGKVRVRLTVGTNGRVKAAEIVSSTPAGVFDQPVMSAVIRWRFKPPQVEGRAVESTTVVSVVFKPADGAR